MTIVHFLKKIKPDICYMNCKKNSFQVLKMAHTAVLWLFQVFFIIFKWLIHILKKKKRNESFGQCWILHMVYIYAKQQISQDMDFFFFFYSILNFLLFAFFLCLLSGHWKLLPLFDLWPSNACIVYTFVTS